MRPKRMQARQGRSLMPEQQLAQSAIVVLRQFTAPCREDGNASPAAIIYSPLQACILPRLALLFEFSP